MFKCMWCICLGDKRNRIKKEAIWDIRTSIWLKRKKNWNKLSLWPLLWGWNRCDNINVMERLPNLQEKYIICTVSHTLECFFFCVCSAYSMHSNHHHHHHHQYKLFALQNPERLSHICTSTMDKPDITGRF